MCNKRFLISLVICLFSTCLLFCQNIHKYDKIIDMHYYKAFYSSDIQTSSFVIYKLYQGGGDVNRASYQFKAYKKLPHFNYTKTGYDRGHLVPAEDLANTNLRLKSTFYYINCVPQTVKLNRGIWKTYESKVRNQSQSDSLIIICGGCDYPNTTDIKKKLIPTKCFKIVYSLSSHKCIYAVIFKNDNSGYATLSPNLKKIFTYEKVKKLYELPSTY